MKKISFLIAAHNEEKIIAKALENLLNFPYKNFEVIIGLDGCTDSTEEIVREYQKKSKVFKYFKLNIRNGKPAVINNIIKKATGEIIVIHDADWIFQYQSEKKVNELFSFFNDKKVGGIAESFPVEWSDSKMKYGNIIYQMVGYSSYLWMDFQKRNFVDFKGKVGKLNTPNMFLTNIFLKKLYKQNTSLGDDFERTKDIFNSGHEILILKDPTYPRMICSYDKILIKDFLKQKIRTAIARSQLTNSNTISVGFNYYLSSVWHIFIKSWKFGISAGLKVSAWIFLSAMASFLSIFSSKDTKKGWKLRARR